MSKDRGDKRAPKADNSMAVETAPEAGAPDPRQMAVPGTPAFVSIHTMREQYLALRGELDRLDNLIAIRIKANKNKPYAIGGSYFVAKAPKGSTDPNLLRLKEKKPRKSESTAEY